MFDPETPADGVNAKAAPKPAARGRWVVLALSGLLIAAVILAMWIRSTPPSRQSTNDDDDRVSAAMNPGYVGIKACAECHARRVEEFQATRHFLACTPATGLRAPGFAPGRGLFHMPDRNLHFTMSRTGDEYLATGIQSTPRGDMQVNYRIDLVYGAGGKGDEMYFGWQDDQLHNLPFAWLYPLNRWGNATKGIVTREAPPNCMECHNTWISHVPGTANEYRRDDMHLGVTCERCHGPGREHVAHHQSRQDPNAHAIVHPGNLSRERLMEVCTQCHSNVRVRGPAFSYRPGEPLEATHRALQTRHPEDFVVANQGPALRQSKCFQKSEMTCVTCHDPHRLPRPDAAQRACAQCHTAADCRDQLRLPAAIRGDCIGCHMPPRIRMNVVFHTADDQYVPVVPRADHHIAVHPEAKQTVLLTWLRTQREAKSRAEADRLAALLTQHWLKEAEQRRREARFKAAIGALREAMKVDPSPTTHQLLREAVTRQAELDNLIEAAEMIDPARPVAAIEALKRILKVQPDHASTHGKLGRMYALTGKREEAAASFREVAKHDPDNPYGLVMLAEMAYLDGRADEAAALCAQANEIDSYSATTHTFWGLSLLKQKRWADAEVHFRKVLTIDPRHARGSQGLSETLCHLGRAEEAVRHGRNAARWTDFQNVEVLMTLAEAYAAAKRPAEARETLEQAITAASATTPDLVPTIRTRLRELGGEGE